MNHRIDRRRRSHKDHVGLEPDELLSKPRHARKSPLGKAPVGKIVPSCYIAMLAHAL
jgi:hypothetical protein